MVTALLEFIIQAEIVYYTLTSTDYYTELYQVSGCKSVTISAKINLDTSGEGPVQLLSGDADSDCPLDIIAELMVHNHTYHTVDQEIFNLCCKH